MAVVWWRWLLRGWGWVKRATTIVTLNNKYRNSLTYCHRRIAFDPRCHRLTNNQPESSMSVPEFRDYRNRSDQTGRQTVSGLFGIVRLFDIRRQLRWFDHVTSVAMVRTKPIGVDPIVPFLESPQYPLCNLLEQGNAVRVQLISFDIDPWVLRAAVIQSCRNQQMTCTFAQCITQATWSQELVSLT
jgi:hypothetical protein